MLRKDHEKHWQSPRHPEHCGTSQQWHPTVDSVWRPTLKEWHPTPLTLFRNRCVVSIYEAGRHDSSRPLGIQNKTQFVNSPARIEVVRIGG